MYMEVLSIPEAVFISALQECSKNKEKVEVVWMNKVEFKESAWASYKHYACSCHKKALARTF